MGLAFLVMMRLSFKVGIPITVAQRLGTPAPPGGLQGQPMGLLLAITYAS